MNTGIKYISFDIFDTLLCRNVSHPRDIFSIVETKIANDFDEGIIPDFANVRYLCEIEARNKIFGEVSLEDIYGVIAEHHPNVNVDIYKKSEINVELDLITANLKVKELYDKYIGEGYSVIIISDMYLSRFVLQTMLEKCGYLGYKKIYISSEIKARKSTGKLFEYVLKDLNIKGTELMHVGDSLRSDFIMALKYGIKVYHISKRSCKTNKDQTENIIQNVAKHGQNIDYAQKIGHEIFGPFIYGYISWLQIQFERGNFDKIYFLSRDGYYMKEAYEALFGESTRISYFYASRRLLQVAALWLSPNLESVLQNMYLPKYFTLGWFADMIGIDSESCEKYIYNETYDLNTRFDRSNLSANRCFIDFYNKIQDEVIENSKREFEALKLKMQVEHFSGKIAIVDVGWIGNMQKLLQTTTSSLGLKVDITGFYVGVELDSPNYNIQKMEGYVFQPGKNEFLWDKTRLCSNILELFFIAPHGSAKKYYVSDKLEPEIDLYESEYNESETYRVFRSIQLSALQTALDLHKVKLYLDLNSKSFYTPFLENFSNPSYKLAKYIGRLKFWDKKWELVICIHSRIKYLICPRLFASDFISSYWRPGFLKLVFIWNVNYGNVLSKIYHLYRLKSS